MKKIRLFFILVMCNSSLFSYAQNAYSNRKSLLKKYKHSDIQQETKKKFGKNGKQGDNDSLVLNPLQFEDTYVYLDSTEFEFNDISVDLEVCNTLPADYQIFLSPLCGRINNMQFYAGIIHENKCIFTRWMERNISALKTNGSSKSSDSEGDFIEVTNSFVWNKGRYRIHLFRSGYEKGKPVASKAHDNKYRFGWGIYEHTWVTMEVENLYTKVKVTAGSLAFPGNKLFYSARNIVFIEHFGKAINFSFKTPNYPFPIMSYKELPFFKVNVSNFRINNKLVALKKVKSYKNKTQNPEQHKIRMPVPELSKFQYDSANGLLHYEVGRLQHAMR